MVQKKYKRTVVFFIVLSSNRSIVLFSYIPFTFPQTLKCFLSNGITNMHTIASGPARKLKKKCQILIKRFCLPFGTFWTLKWFGPFCLSTTTILPYPIGLINIMTPTICLLCLHLGLAFCHDTILLDREMH